MAESFQHKGLKEAVANWYRENGFYTETEAITKDGKIDVIANRPDESPMRIEIVISHEPLWIKVKVKVENKKKKIRFIHAKGIIRETISYGTCEAWGCKCKACGDVSIPRGGTDLHNLPSRCRRSYCKQKFRDGVLSTGQLELIAVKACHCNRCGNLWLPKEIEPAPEICSRHECSSHYWNRPRKLKARAIAVAKT